MPENVSAPMPQYATPFLNKDGRTVNEVWFRFLWTLLRRSGGEGGIDLTALKQRVDDLDDLTNSTAPSLALVTALISRIVELERRELGFVPLPPGSRPDWPATAAVAAPGSVALPLDAPVPPIARFDHGVPPVALPAPIRIVAGQVKISKSLADGAASQAATLTNAPLAGNPTKWIPVNDNGTIRHVPLW